MFFGELMPVHGISFMALLFDDPLCFGNISSECCEVSKDFVWLCVAEHILFCGECEDVLDEHGFFIITIFGEFPESIFVSISSDECEGDGEGLVRCGWVECFSYDLV